MKFRLLVIGLIALIISVPAFSAEPEMFPFLATVQAKKVNIRAGQSKSFESIGELEQGAEVVVVQQSYSWYKIKLPEHVKCYVSRELVHFLKDQIGEIKGNRVNIRSRADLNSAILGQLNKMTKIKILETLDEWYRIQPIEGVYGWIHSDLVQFVSKNIPAPVTVQMPSRNIYKIKHEEEVLKKEQEAQRLAKEAEQKIKLKGTVELIFGQSAVQNIRHKVIADDGQVFYLKGYRSILDGFLNHRVQVEGLPQDDVKMDKPVLLVTKVLLVL